MVIIDKDQLNSYSDKLISNSVAFSEVYDLKHDEVLDIIRYLIDYNHRLIEESKKDGSHTSRFGTKDFINSVYINKDGKPALIYLMNRNAISQLSSYLINPNLFLNTDERQD